MSIADSTRPELPVPPTPGGMLPRYETPLVPRHSIAGRALIAVVAIMTFLVSLTTGAVILVGSAASAWQSDVAREVTIQVLPAPGRDVDATVEKAVSVTRAFPGIGDVRSYTKAESIRLLEPWLGTGLSLDELPVPRLIVSRSRAGRRPISRSCAAYWRRRFRARCSTIIAAGSTVWAPWPAPRWAAASPSFC